MLDITQRFLSASLELTYQLLRNCVMRVITSEGAYICDKNPLFIGSILMFITAGMMSMPLAQNIGEAAFAIGLMLTQARAAKN